MTNQSDDPASGGRGADIDHRALIRQARASLTNGEYKGAVRMIRAYLTSNAGTTEIYSLLGAALLKANESQAAVAAFEQACILDPSNFDALVGRAVASRNANMHDMAAALLEKALDLQPDSSACRIELAKTLIELERADDAKSVLDKVAMFDRKSLNVDLLYAEIFSIKNDQATARRCVYRALKRSPGNSAALLALSKVEPQSNLLARPELAERLDDPKIAIEEKRNLGFALGRAREARGVFDAAFQAYRLGNDAQGSLSAMAVGAYSRNSQEQLIDDKIALYQHDRVLALSQYGLDERRPIFVVGMPRSGTTLVEQILSSHPDVFGGGERRTLATACAYFEKSAVNAKNALAASVPKVFFRRAADIYFEKLPDEAADFARFTDKNPHNFYLLGVIRILFPHARIIHCRRNGLDTCVSNYFQLFSFPHNYSNRLEDLAHYYSQYMRLFEYWRGYGKDDLLEIDYEAIIEYPEQSVRRLLEHCALPWNERCLEYYKNDRPVYTPSQTQVRTPLYRSSIGRWRHFERNLAPLLAGFGAKPFQ